MKDWKNHFAGKRVTVMGLGLLGRGLNDTRFLVECGAHVTVTDLKSSEELKPSLEALRDLPNITYKLGGHDPDDFTSVDMILRNADVPKHSQYLRLAEEHNVPVEMDESLFCKLFTGKVIGVTGTRGKTTTTTLIHEILSAHHPAGVHLAGNIMGKATLPLLPHVQHNDYVVLELSSWQLQGFHKAEMSPNYSVFTNIYPDHLNRYSGMQEYIYDKKAIYLYQRDGDFCVFNGEQPASGSLAREAPAGTLYFATSDVPEDWDIRIPGSHNLQNIAAATMLTHSLGVPIPTIKDAVEKFKGIEHRLEVLGQKHGVNFVNDSTSTTPIAGCVALDSIQRGRILLIAGGADKKLDLTPFAHAAVKKAAYIALLDGTATPALTELINREGGAKLVTGTFQSLKSAVYSLIERAGAGDTILLSPGCASFGLFKNEFHRGNEFVRIVNDYLKES